MNKILNSLVLLIIGLAPLILIVAYFTYSEKIVFPIISIIFIIWLVKNRKAILK